MAVVAYGIAASSNACQSTVNGLKKAGVHVSYTDLNVQFPGTGIASDVQRMQQAGSDIVFSCMDVTGNIAMSRAIQQFGLKINQLWLSGADQTTINQYPTLTKGVYFEIQHVPFAAPLSVYPGLALYLSAMRKYEPKFINNEVAIQGWELASLLAAGIKAAGADLTQQNVVNQINKITNFTANGLTTPVNWTTAHTIPSPPFCQAYIQVANNKLEPRFGKGKQVFVCFGGSLKPIPVTPAPGTPGT